MINEFKPIVSPYFGEKGITATSANHIANLLKESYEAIEAELDHISFVSEYFGLIGTSEDNFTLGKKAISDGNYNTFAEKLDYIASAKSFIAFLREAIKEKNRLNDEIQQFTLKELEELKYPVADSAISKEDVLNAMSIRDREHYLSLETEAAVYGKFIHPNGGLDRAKKKLISAITNPNEVQYNGRDTIIRLFKPTITSKELNETYAKLQAHHRTVEAELNSFKYQIEETIRKDAEQKLDAYNKALRDYKNKERELYIEETKVKEARRKEVETLRIVIPNRFINLYKEITKKD